jgi:putative nucleotidyltransferase with HDIG domain
MIADALEKVVQKADDLEERKEKKELNTHPLDPSYPLLAEFREKAPGTYKHTQSLMAIVENVCASIDMDEDSLRLAVTYHDIGKMWAPELFTENQGENNIHDELDPHISYHLITRHVSDSVTIMVASGFPMEAIHIASQHHGTSLLRSMYDKVKSKGPKVPEDLFRYHTPRPDKLESLILMLCDQVEAASRSLYVDQKRKMDPVIFINNVYSRLHLDGQFDNVSVLLGKIKKIQAALITDIASNFQKRVAYESDKELENPKEE